MALNDGHKGIIEASISHLIDLPQNKEELKQDISLLKQAFTLDVLKEEHKYKRLKNVIDTPTNDLGTIENMGSVTVGEIREGILDLANSKINEAATELGVTSDKLGWNTEEIQSTLNLKEDKDNNFVTTRRIPSNSSFSFASSETSSIDVDDLFAGIFFPGNEATNSLVLSSGGQGLMFIRASATNQLTAPQQQEHGHNPQPIGIFGVTTSNRPINEEETTPLLQEMHTLRYSTDNINSGEYRGRTTRQHTDNIEQRDRSRSRSRSPDNNNQENNRQL